MNTNGSQFSVFPLSFFSFHCSLLAHFRLQEGQGTEHRAQLFPSNEVHPHEQGADRECQVSHMEGMPWQTKTQSLTAGSS